MIHGVVLGTGSRDSQELLSLSQRILEQASLPCSLYLESDVESIATYDVDITPALLLDGVIVYSAPGAPRLEVLQGRIQKFVDKHTLA